MSVRTKRKGKKIRRNSTPTPSLTTPYLLEKKHNKVVAHLINKQGKGYNHPIWVPKEIVTTMKGSKKVWVPKTT